MWRNAKTVALREFWVTVRRPGYLITTFGMPIFIALYALIAIIPPLLIEKKEAARRVAGLVDEAGVLDPAELGEVSKLPEGAAEAMKALDAAASGEEGKKAESITRVKVDAYESREQAREALDKKEIFSYFVIPADYLDTGKVLVYTSGSGLLDKGRWREAFLRRALVASLLKGKIDDVVAARVQRPVALEEIVVDAKGERKKSMAEEMKKIFVPMGFSVFLMLSILTGAGFLVQGVAEEKENRVMEVILSSVTPQSFFWGKLLGLGTAGFLQLVVWLLLVAVPLSVVSSAAKIEVPPALVVLALAYFVVGFFMMASLIMGSGALGTNLKEAQQLSMVWSMTMVPGMMFIILIVDEPTGTAARVLSYIPFTAPTTMIAREVLGAAPWWEHALVIAWLLACTWLAVKFSAKLFRIGLLLYGKRPTMKEIWRYLREA